jgi:hypothetical protein
MAGGGTVVLESHDNVYGPGGQYVEAVSFACSPFPFTPYLPLI